MAKTVLYIYIYIHISILRAVDKFYELLSHTKEDIMIFGAFYIEFIKNSDFLIAMIF